MRRAVLGALLVALVILPACRRAPEPELPPPPTPTPVPAPLPPITPLALPLTNPAMGITLTSLPDGLVAAYSGEEDLMLTEADDRYSRVFFRFEPEAGPLDPARYHLEARISVERYGDGRQTAAGSFPDGPFGATAWSARRFTEDGIAYDQVELVTPHPSGAGLLYLWADYPEGQRDPNAKLEELRELLARVQAAAG